MARPGIEQLYGPVFRGMPRTKTGGSAPFAGRTTIASGSIAASVATTVANSDSIITMTPETGVASIALGTLCVSSISPGTGFTFQWAAGVAVTKDIVVHWRLTGTS